MDPNKLTLRTWHDQFFVALFQPDVRPRTHEEYSATLNHWERLTCNPKIQKITALDVAEFRGKLASEKKPATVNKNLRHINHLLAKAGPAGPHNRDAMNLISTVPWAKALRTFQRRPSAASMEAVRLFYKACPTDWWRAWVACAFHLGSRCHALSNLKECDVDFASRQAIFRAEFDKRRTERVKPLSTCVVQHLVPLRGKGLLATTKTKTAFYKAWHRIENDACLTPEQKFTPHALKRACGTQLARAGASTWAVKYMLDHAQTDVTGCSYIDPLNELTHLVELLPSPEPKKLKPQLER